MYRLVAGVGIAFVFAVLVLCSRPAFPANHKFVEDFATTQHRDAPNTTAWWDTTARELKLFPLPRLAASYDTPGYAEGVVSEN